jgi:hypothetical protein
LAIARILYHSIKSIYLYARPWIATDELHSRVPQQLMSHYADQVELTTSRQDVQILTTALKSLGYLIAVKLLLAGTLVTNTTPIGDWLQNETNQSDYGNIFNDLNLNGRIVNLLLELNGTECGTNFTYHSYKGRKVKKFRSLG